MKSIMEQASSIIKAIEKAWDRAEKPKEFSIKIFEKEEKNFFGMTTKPAKIGIFFEDKNTLSHEKPVAKPRQETRELPQQTNSRQTEAHKKSHPQKVQQSRVEHQKTEPTAKTGHAKTEATKGEYPPRSSAAWTEQMIHTTENWIKKTLSLMGKADIGLTAEVAGKNLKITFNEPLIENPLHEKQLFRSTAHLIMASLRNQYKQEIKDLKVILIRPSTGHYEGTSL
jgi:predicted RNA-binding protein Jag